MARSAGILFLWILATPLVCGAQEEITTNNCPCEEPVPCERFWGRAEYLLWRIKSDQAPAPLLTTGPAGSPTQGILGQPGTVVLYGTELDYRLNSGGKFVLGTWLTSNQILGIELSGFALETHTIHGEVNSNRTDGAPVLARPFFNTLTQREDALVITSPQDALGGRYLGGIDIFGDSRTWGGEANLVTRLGQTWQGTWDLVGGFRYLGQKDELRFSHSATVLTPGTVGFRGQPAPAPNIVSWRDYYETLNHFYGGQVGAQGRWQWRFLTADLAGKFGLGTTEQRLHVSGHTLLTDPTGLTLRQEGGLYNQPSNIGDFSRHEFSFISEIDFRLGVQLGQHWNASLGYTFLFWDNVVRPGNQVNRNVDPRQIPSNLAFGTPGQPAQPVRLFQGSDFWAQGLTVGLEFRY